MNIQIAGITGMLGSAVSQAARKRGHAVTATGDIAGDVKDELEPSGLRVAGKRLVRHAAPPERLVGVRRTSSAARA